MIKEYFDTGSTKRFVIRDITLDNRMSHLFAYFKEAKKDFPGLIPVGDYILEVLK